MKNYPPTAEQFVEALARVKLDLVFNPYRDRCEVNDVAKAPDIRKANLLLAVRAAIASSATDVWIGRDLGHRGGRRTGLALTDDVNLPVYARVWGGLPFLRATSGKLVAERTATVAWSIIEKSGRPIFLWNLFPFHPFERNDPFSNRTHNSEERKLGEKFLIDLLALLRPRLIVAVGNDAHQGLARIGIAHNAVRHPSYGGQADFLAAMSKLYGIEDGLTGVSGQPTFPNVFPDEAATS